MKTFYGLTGNPFASTPDPQFLYRGPTHRETFQLLIRSQQRPNGILVVTGARGTGKTLLLKAFAEAQEPPTRVVYLPHAVASVQDLFMQLAQQTGLADDTLPTGDPVSQMNAWLRTCIQHGEKIVLLLDNAHEWSESLLTQIEVLARLGAPKHPLFQLVLAGPLSLPDFLMAPTLAPLRARIEGMAHLSPFDLLDTQAYIRHRLTLAGWHAGSLFDTAAVEVIYRYSQGVPRTINQLCSQALLAGFAAQVPCIEADLVSHVAARMGLHEPAPPCPAHDAPARLRTVSAQSQAPVAQQLPDSDTSEPSPAGQARGKPGYRRSARLALTLLPLGVILLLAAGSVLRPEGALQERRTVSLTSSLPGVDKGLSETPEPQPTSGRAPKAKAATAAEAIPSNPGVPSVRAVTDRREPQPQKPEKQVDPSSPEVTPTVSTERRIATTLLSKALSPGVESSTPRETLPRLPQSPGTAGPPAPRVQRGWRRGSPPPQRCPPDRAPPRVAGLQAAPAGGGSTWGGPPAPRVQRGWRRGSWGGRGRRGGTKRPFDFPILAPHARLAPQTCRTRYHTTIRRQRVKV